MQTNRIIKLLKRVPVYSIWIITTLLLVSCAFIYLCVLNPGDWRFIMISLCALLFCACAMARVIKAMRQVLRNGKLTVESLERRSLLDAAVHDYQFLVMTYPRVAKASTDFNFRFRQNAVSNSFIYIFRDNIILTYDEVVGFGAANWYTPTSHRGERNNDVYYVTTKEGICYDLFVVRNRRYTEDIRNLIEQTVNILRQKNPDCVIDLTLRFYGASYE